MPVFHLRLQRRVDLQTDTNVSVERATPIFRAHVRFMKKIGAFIHG